MDGCPHLPVSLNILCVHHWGCLYLGLVFLLLLLGQSLHLLLLLLDGRFISELNNNTSHVVCAKALAGHQVLSAVLLEDHFRSGGQTLELGLDYGALHDSFYVRGFGFQCLPPR